MDHHSDRWTVLLWVGHSGRWKDDWLVTTMVRSTALRKAQQSGQKMDAQMGHPTGFQKAPLMAGWKGIWWEIRKGRLKASQSAAGKALWMEMTKGDRWAKLTVV